MKRLRKLNRFFGYVSVCGGPLAAFGLSAGACGDPFSSCEAHRSCPTAGGEGGEGATPDDRGGSGGSGGTDGSGGSTAGTNNGGAHVGGVRGDGGTIGDGDAGAGGRRDCDAGMKACDDGGCVPEDGCCVESDCTESCQTCSEGSCVTVESADDPDSCAGTCDAKGVCKSAQGQECQTGNGCIAGTTCAPDGVCCDTACTNSCEACDVKGFEGTCTPVASGKPHGNRAACEGDDASCAGSCTGREDGQCTFPTRSCGAETSCSGSKVIGPSACAEGSCVAPKAAVCEGGFACAGSACKASCATDSDCVADHFCQGGTCHLDAKQVALGYDHVCVLVIDGTVRCWGNNGSGQLGDGTKVKSLTPVQVKGLTGATAISAGMYSVCALLSDGSVRCWGQPVGTNDAAAESFKVEGLAKATAVDVSNSHACAILTDGSAACWGWNSNGGLGDGSKAKSLAPVAVKDLTSTTSISTGSYFTCALAAQVPSCWGLNSIGQLGNGNTTDSVTHVSVNVENGTAVIATSRGGNHACAVLSASSVKCWGYNYFGQLGNGTPTPSPSTPTATPVTVTGLSGAKALALGNNHSCALLTDGSVKCWGLNGEGELGNASTTSAAVPTGVTGLRDVVKQLGAGGDATCAVLANGAVQCWGAGTVLGSTVDALAPQLAPEW